MPAHIALLVLFAALLHATWNTIVKGGENKLYESALNALGGGLGALCLVPFLSFPASAAWPFLGLSCCCHLAYYVSIAEVYKVVDLSVGYTIMRGSAPLFTAVAMVSLGTSLSPAGWGGLLAICSGIACLALQGGPSRLGRHGLWLVLRTAFIIMGYTLSDGFGGQRSGDSVGYACWIFVLNIFPLHAVVLARSGRDYLRYARKRALPSLGGGLCGLGSYGIAIWAMSAAPIALVAALRQGPWDRDWRSALPDWFAIQSVWLDDGVCYANLLSSTVPADTDREEAGLALQALRDSLASLDSVRRSASW